LRVTVEVENSSSTKLHYYTSWGNAGPNSKRIWLAPQITISVVPAPVAEQQAQQPAGLLSLRNIRNLHAPPVCSGSFGDCAIYATV